MESWGERMGEERAEKVRVYVDGCFDVLHYGHANALRQAAELGDEVVAAVCCDGDVTELKRRPLLSQSERARLLQSLRWVDEVRTDVTYWSSPSAVRDADCHIGVHDDNAVIANGIDTSAELRAAGMYKYVFSNRCRLLYGAHLCRLDRSFRRTNGISTSELIKR